MQPAPPPMTLAQAGIVPAWMDRSVDPCTDFFAYACGGFVKTAEIPPDRASWGAIEMVTKDAEDFLHDYLEKAAAAPNGDAAHDKLGAFYGACMDEAAIEKAGTAPIKPWLDAIAKVKDAKSAARAVIALQADGMSPLFDLGPTQDYADATQMIAGLDQDGLGLPDKKYYLDKSGSLPKTREAYRAHQVRMFQLLGDDAKHAKAAADHAWQVELALAKLSQDEVTRRNPHAVYHRVERAGLEKLAPSFPWGDLLTSLGIGQVTQITVNDPAYYSGIAKLVRTTPPAVMRDYLTWIVLDANAERLGKAWVDEAFTMRKVLWGVKELPPRWRTCVRQADRSLGELLGQVYVASKFSPAAKARATDLTQQILAAMGTELAHLPWMDDATRAAATAKLAKMSYLVGYPDAWKTYDFVVSRDYAADVLAAHHWELHRQLAKIGKPVDRTDWHMTPQTVNAYNDPTLNEIVLPAGQLQPPFFGATFHPAVNFGSTGGGTIGHEMTHGFDDEGSQFDGRGNLRDWWSPSTKAAFDKATTCIQNQYGAYEAVPGVKLDGKLTSGENIADNGGVKIAYEAYQAWRAQQNPPPPRTVEGFSDDQLYYLAYAQSWCEKITPEELETMAHSNPHSPAKWRVDGVVVNQPGFGPAFQCKQGTPMNPGSSCSVW
jgi:predicted metalloendopeptidase